MSRENSMLSGIFSLVTLHKAAPLWAAQKSRRQQEERWASLSVEPKPDIPGLTQISGKINKTIPVGLQDTTDNRSHQQIRLGGFPEMDNFLKGLSKLFIKHSIYYWIDKGVEIAKPGEEVKEGWVEPAGVPADGEDQRCDKEGQPTDDEGPQDDPQRLGGFPFSSSGNPLALQDTIGQLDFHVVEKESGAGSMGVPLVEAGAERAERGPRRARDEVGRGEALPVERRRIQDAVPGGHVDAAVEDDEQYRRDVEGPAGGVDGVGDLRRVHQAV